jgi:DNA adenine methylase
MSRAAKLHEPLDFAFDDVLTAIADENKPSVKAIIARPFVKWVGGKRSILPALLARMPAEYDTYVEPFLGGAALFYAVNPPRAYLSDVNFSLILTYQAVRDDVDGVIAALKRLQAAHDKEAYLRARLKIAKEDDPTKIAALFIYLNKTCYNGLYRVNKSGAFNVPMGSYTDPTIVAEENLRAATKELASAEIRQHSFEHVPIRPKNFYYLDPPYHKTFSSYDRSGFGDADHENLAKFCAKLHEAGCFFMLSNSDTPFVRKLYKDFQIENVQASRMVSCKGNQRGKESELLIRNYEVQAKQDGHPS